MWWQTNRSVSYKDILTVQVKSLIKPLLQECLDSTSSHYWWAKTPSITTKPRWAPITSQAASTALRIHHFNQSPQLSAWKWFLSLATITSTSNSWMSSEWVRLSWPSEKISSRRSSSKSETPRLRLSSPSRSPYICKPGATGGVGSGASRKMARSGR